MNVNVFLKQFKRSNEAVAELIKNGNTAQMDIDQCKVLSSFLPTDDDMQPILAHKGDAKELGTAEQFYLLLWKIPSFRQRVECMQLRHEFAQGYNYLYPALCSMKDAAQEIEENEELCEMFSIVLVAGNFINMGGYAGNAAGFKLDSLTKMDDTKANKPRMTLTHYVVKVVEDTYPHILDIGKKLPNLDKASSLSLDTLQSDFNDLKKKLTSVGWSLEEAVVDLKQQMADFVDASNAQLNTLENLMEDVYKLTNRLATFFCEDPGAFKLENLFQMIKSFVTRMNAAHQENIQRKQREAREEKQRQQKEEKARKEKEKAEESGTGQPPEVCPFGCVDQLLSSIRGGSKLRQSVKVSKKGRGRLASLRNSVLTVTS
jgi:hypothetical protein